MMSSGIRLGDGIILDGVMLHKSVQEKIQLPEKLLFIVES